MKCRVSYLLRFYLTTVVLFVAAKVVFMLVYRDGQAFAAADVLQVVAHGLSLDLSTALYLLIVPFLLSVAAVWLKVPRWLFRGYAVFAAVILALAFVADTSLYAFWRFKLDASCLTYLQTPTEALASVTPAYIAFRVGLTAVTAALLYLILPHWPHSSHKPRRVYLPHALRESLLYLLLTPVIIIGIRGGLGESTTNIGQVYFSPNQFLNHAAVNPLFSFLASLGKSGDYIVSYDYFTDQECADLTDRLFTTESSLTDSLLTTTRPNIVVIIMESCGGQFTQIGGNPGITPRLNQLAGEGIYFSQCYANSWRTDKGVVSILSGYPAFPVTSVMKVPEKSRKLPSIAASLADNGYHSSFFYGGDINFTNMRSYLMATGYSRLTWKNDFTADEQHSAQWGVRDDIMLDALLNDITGEQRPHWMKTLLTLSSHEPWDVPDPVEATDWNPQADPVLTAFHYLDRCIGQFIDNLRKTPQWAQTLVVILPDHGLRHQGVDETTRLYNHIPMLWVGGAVSSPRVVDRLCCQSDLAATLLAQLGIDHSRYVFSRDIMSSTYRCPTAYHTYNNGVTLYDSTGFVAYDLDARQVIAREGDSAPTLLRQAKAILQRTSHDLKRK